MSWSVCLSATIYHRVASSLLSLWDLRVLALLACDFRERTCHQSRGHRDDRNTDESDDRRERLASERHWPDFTEVDIDEQSHSPPQALSERSEVLRLRLGFELVNPYGCDVERQCAGDQEDCGFLAALPERARSISP